MKRTALFLFVGILLWVACLSTPEPTPTVPTESEPDVAESSANDSAEATPEPSFTPAPTTAPTDTAEPEPTEAEMPMEAVELLAPTEPETDADPNVVALGLTGQLLFTQGTAGLWQVDLAQGVTSQLFAVPEGGHLGGVAASPDGTQLVLAYGPPPESGPQLGITDIYLMNIGEATLEPLVLRTAEIETFANPIWSADGEWIYFSHLKQDDTGINLSVERFGLSSQTHEVIIEGAHQPSVSADMQHLTYLKFDFEEQVNALWIANLDGSEARELVPVTRFSDVHAPRFSNDGSTVVFGASGGVESEEEETFRFWDALMGVRTAYAHGAPWAIWSVTLADNTLTPLTETIYDGAWPSVDPDGEQFAFLEAEAIYFVADDGLHRVGVTTREGELLWTK